MSKKWKVAGIDFSHMHMGDNLKYAFDHPDVDIVGICHHEREPMESSIKNFDISEDRVFTDYKECLEQTNPDIIILCSATARHAESVEQVAPYGAHIMVEKPFASSLAEADRMVAAISDNQQLIINWPLMWVPVYITTKRMIDEGHIGDVLEVHTYGGNRGPLYHVDAKAETSPEYVAEQKPKSWFYKAAEGGGSLLDYIGYGTTLGTWYQGGRAPIEVTSTWDEPKGLEVDEHSITVARYAHGLSKFETRWGTFTDPWIIQPQPKCGFVIVGTDGTIASYDYESTLRMQTREKPEGFTVDVDPLEAPNQNPIQYLIHCLENDQPIEGPLSTEISRTGQQIVDTAFQSAKEKRTLPLMQ
jgi:predicted dehydrogenase